jgi:hypothetical protein
MPELRFLHPDSALSKVKLELFEKFTTEQLILTLAPGESGCLKTRADGTVLDGHHRLRVLQSRGIDIEKLPRETIEKSGY